MLEMLHCAADRAYAVLLSTRAASESDAASPGISTDIDDRLAQDCILILPNPAVNLGLIIVHACDASVGFFSKKGYYPLVPTNKIEDIPARARYKPVRDWRTNYLQTSKYKENCPSALQEQIMMQFLKKPLLVTVTKLRLGLCSCLMFIISQAY